MTQNNNGCISQPTNTATQHKETTNFNNLYKDNIKMNNNRQDNATFQIKIDTLKSSLSSILSCTALKKESATSYAGACPKCGGNDRFVYNTNSGNCWCRQCKPESESMDIIAFHCWKDNKTVSDLMREYLPKDNPQTKQEIDLNTEWQIILDHSDPLSFARCEALLKSRGISDATIKSLYDDGKIKGTNRHRRTDTMAVAYTPLNTTQQEEIPIAIQYLKIDQQPFYMMEKNKSFHKGSQIGGLCFFQCGKAIDDPETQGIIIVEGVINAITGMDILPNYTWLAIGGSGFTKKIEAIKNYANENQGTINNGIPIICAFDNDPAGEKASLKIGKMLKDINNCIFEIQFPEGTPNKYDLNDYIRIDKDPTRTPQPEAIIDLINKAQIIADKSTKTEKVKIDTSKIFQETESKIYPDNQESEKPKVYLIAGKQPEAVKECQNILNDGSIYQRGKTLFRISQEQQKPRNGIINGNSYHLQEVNAVWLQDRLNEIATFISFKVDKKTGEVTEIINNCPRIIAEIILVKSGSWDFPYITGIAETPTLRNDGSIIQTAGYDPLTGLYMAIDDKWNIPDAPTKADALKSYNKLEYLLKDFEFTDEESKTAVISAILTGTVRRLLPSAPAFCFDAPKRGSGKTLLANTIGNIITGNTITTINYGKDEIEFSKRIDSILFRGDPVINIDNIEIPVSGDTICSILTNETHNPRILGKSEQPKVETNILIMFTGNNTVFKGDMVRRVLVSRIDPKCENPEDRTFDIDLKEYSKNNRRELVTAALTIIRAYFVAGSPRLNVKNYGCFEKWCEFARYPLIWIGKTDPIKSRDKIKDSDPVTGNLKELLEAWNGVYGNKEKTAKEVAEDVRTKFNNQKNLTPEQERLIDIVELIAIDNNGIVNNRRFGNFIAKYRDRFEGNFRFVKSGAYNRALKYVVESILQQNTTQPEEEAKQEETAPEQNNFKFDSDNLNVNLQEFKEMPSFCSVCMKLDNGNNSCKWWKKTQNDIKCSDFEACFN